jgi:hypothetical protein
MTEAEWLNAREAFDLYWHPCATAGRLRKLRLAAVACCRLAADLLPDPASREALTCAERAADGAATPAELAAAEGAAQLVAQRAFEQCIPPGGITPTPTKRSG